MAWKLKIKQLKTEIKQNIFSTETAHCVSRHDLESIPSRKMSTSPSCGQFSLPISNFPSTIKCVTYSFILTWGDTTSRPFLLTWMLNSGGGEISRRTSDVMSTWAPIDGVCEGNEIKIMLLSMWYVDLFDFRRYVYFLCFHLSVCELMDTKFI